MKKIYCIILFMEAIVVYSQHSPYNVLVNKASKQAFSCEFQESLNTYKELIEFQEFTPFYHDLKNAFHIAYIIQDNKTIKQIIEVLISKKYITPDFFKRDFSVDNPKLFDYYKKRYCAIKKENRPESFYRESLLKIYETDQAVRNRHNQMDEFDYRQRDRMDSLNFMCFSNLIDVRQFYGEDELGVYLEEEYLWNIYGLLFRHFVQVGFGDELLQILNDSLIVENKIPAGVLANVIDLNNNYKREFFSLQNQYVTVVGPYVCKPLIKYDTLNIKTLNNSRSSAGLPRFHESFSYFIASLYCDNKIGSKLNFHPFAYVDHIPMMFYESQEDQEYLKSLTFSPRDYVPHCFCTKIKGDE